MKPILRYVGGKWRQWKWIGDLLEGEGYREYCIGGGAVLARRRKTRGEVISDANERLINFYKVVQGKHRELIELIESGGEIDREGFEKCRAMQDRELGDVWNAYVYLVVNRFSWYSHGSQYDADRRWGNVVERIKWWCWRLQDVKIECADVNKRRWDGKVIFIDPPYVHHRRMVVNLYEKEMSIEDHVELLEKCVKATKKRVVICGVESTLYHSYLKTWNKREWQIKIGCGKDMMRECVWWNN